MAAVEKEKAYEFGYGLFQSGRLEELERFSQRLIQADPGDGRAHQLLGIAFLGRGMHLRAIQPLERASELMPTDAEVWDNLGLACSSAGQFAEADSCFRKAVQIDPGALAAWVNWSGSALKSGDAQLALQCAQRALALRADVAAAHLNLGNALMHLARLEEAERHLRAAIRLAPGWVEAELSLGVLLETSGRATEAVECLLHVMARHPGDWRAHTNLGRLQSSLGDASAAVASYTRAVELNPQALEAFSGMLFLRLHEEGVDPVELFAQHCRYGETVEAPFRAHWGGYPNTRDPERRLRVGFVSGDMRRHAVAYFMEPCFQGLLAADINVVVYSNHPAEDEVTARLKGLVGAWRKVIGMSDEQLAGQIREDEIDILVDLSGHTAYNRLPMFARKPAPLQLSWLGYPGTTGLRAIDYRPVNGAGVPAGLLDDQFTEKLLYLPAVTTFRNSADAPEVSALPALQNGYVTFANLNRPSKIGEGAVGLWSRVLHAVPASRMLLGGVDDQHTEDLLRDAFASHGIDPGRLDFFPYLPMKDYLALHHRIDIMLDSFPYAGGTTSQHAIRMGVPVVTLAGRMLPQRMGASIMNAAGLPDWVTENASDYVDRAVRAAQDLPSLAKLRAGLREHVENDPSRRPDEVARSFEAALRHIWRRWCAGLEAEAVDLFAGRRNNSVGERHGN